MVSSIMNDCLVIIYPALLELKRLESITLCASTSPSTESTLAATPPVPVPECFDNG